MIARALILLIGMAIGLGGGYLIWGSAEEASEPVDRVCGSVRSWLAGQDANAEVEAANAEAMAAAAQDEAARTHLLDIDGVGKSDHRRMLREQSVGLKRVGPESSSGHGSLFEDQVIPSEAWGSNDGT